MGILLPRDDCERIDGRWYCREYSRWHDWGRWVAFAVIVGVALLIFFTLACFNARRRRRQGLRPYAGTAWMAPPPPYHQQSHADPYNRPPPPPQYTQSPGPHGYFGGQQTGIELQQPPNAHYGGGPVYSPPAGPPPPKP
ncbi:chitin synthesis regulation, resistance to congo red-domain-containing protein [Aspergillus carlsbadensis]|nr:chitin synthesis regulation, resistance to congo red-domain-containing protein [Aspergillus carlsbadensis]